MSQAARELEDEHDLQGTMDVAVRLAAENVRGSDAVALTILAPDGIDTPAYTARAALDADLLQYTLGEGPCLDAAQEARVVHSPDIDADPRWAEWGPRAAHEYGAHSVLCLQLFTEGHSLGALNHYSFDRGSFSAQDRDDALALSTHIAVAVAGAQTAAHLLTALDSRTVIGQAVGIVMERYGIDAATAFKVLARVSSETNIKVRDIATELVTTGVLHEPS